MNQRVLVNFGKSDDCLLTHLTSEEMEMGHMEKDASWTL